MSLIVAARFTTFPAAEDAAQRLFNAGFVEEDVTLFFVNPPGQHGVDTGTDANARGAPKGAEIGVTIGAVVGAMVGVGIFAAFSAPLIVSLIAAGVSAYVGSLAGAMVSTSEVSIEDTRDSGVLVAVHVSPDSQSDAARVLRDAGGAAIERATGRWQQGRWADFDPLKQPVPLNEFSEKHA
jgi:S-formylglutathione hydrolase FrmB